MEPREILSAGGYRRERLTRDLVLARFAEQQPVGRRGSHLAATPGLRGDHSLNPGTPPPSTGLTGAAVLVPLVDHPTGLTVLLTQRTAHLSDHAGQISFPGGRIEPSDEHPVAAALREAEEEVGLPASYVDIVGRLDTYVTGTGFEIVPVVALVRPPYPLRPDPFEVAEVFEVPLDFLVDPGNLQRGSREWKGTTRFFFALPYKDRYIWGATAGMLVNLAEVLAPELAGGRPRTDF
jgi:8-oxo-dGTP pyrophosphatase MutT (NUDIX family)